jgi:hypothetical protein
MPRLGTESSSIDRTIKKKSKLDFTPKQGRDRRG